MHWYIAKLVYRIVCGDGAHTPQYDEQVRLFEAASAGEAFRKARAAGKAEEVSFPNAQQQMVQWLFIAVSELFTLPQVVDGAELYSRIEEKDNPVGYEALLRQKAAKIAAQTTSLRLT